MDEKKKTTSPETVGHTIAGITYYYPEELKALGLEISLQNLRNKLKSGEIKGRKVGNKWHITENALRDYLEGR